MQVSLQKNVFKIVILVRPALWSSGQFPTTDHEVPGSWGFFLEREDPHSDHVLGSLVEIRFKVPPGTSYSYITIHLIGTT
jgi:hypothetical protein